MCQQLKKDYMMNKDAVEIDFVGVFEEGFKSVATADAKIDVQKEYLAHVCKYKFLTIELVRSLGEKCAVNHNFRFANKVVVKKK